MISDLGLDGLIRLARLKFAFVNFLVVALEFVFASKADLVIFAAELRAFKVLGHDAVLGRTVAFQVTKAFGDEVAVGVTASVISRLAVMEGPLLVIKECL